MVPARRRRRRRRRARRRPGRDGNAASARRTARPCRGLERSRRQLRAFTANEEIGLRVVDPDGRTTWADGATAHASLGYEPNEYVGEKASARAPTSTQRSRPRCTRCLATGRPIENVRATLRRKDGTAQDVLLNSNTPSGRPHHGERRARRRAPAQGPGTRRRRHQARRLVPARSAAERRPRNGTRSRQPPRCHEARVRRAEVCPLRRHRRPLHRLRRVLPRRRPDRLPRVELTHSGGCDTFGVRAVPTWDIYLLPI